MVMLDVEVHNCCVSVTFVLLDVFVKSLVEGHVNEHFGFSVQPIQSCDQFADPHEAAVLNLEFQNSSRQEAVKNSDGPGRRDVATHSPSGDVKRVSQTECQNNCFFTKIKFCRFRHRG